MNLSMSVHLVLYHLYRAVVFFLKKFCFFKKKSLIYDIIQSIQEIKQQSPPA